MVNKINKKEKQKLDKHGLCPICKKSWDAGDIPKELRKHYSAPYKWSHLIGIEIRGEYDGVCMWQCPFCKTKWNRWTEEIVNEGCVKQ